MTKTLEISEETYELIKDQLPADELTDVSTLDDLVGKKFYIRTVTYHCTGEVTKRIGAFIEMKNAAWIADSGRFSDAIKKGELDEVEPVGTMWVNLNSVVDMFPWKHKLPTEVK